MKKLLISGSIAYDVIMDFPDSFKHHILPDHIHMLNVSFLVDRLEKNYGGTSGNIGYTTKLLGGDPIILGSVGKDGKEYLDHLQEKNIDTASITQRDDVYTATAHITTDKDDNQITAFYPGSIASDDDLVLPTEDFDGMVLISPTKVEVMSEHAKVCAEAGIPFCFDPGQQITALSGQDLMRIIGQATYLIGNDYELTLLENKTGWDTEKLLDHVDMIILTLGDKGSKIITKDEVIDIPPCTVSSVQDPTGAGDAYRAGFFTGLLMGKPMTVCGRMASVAASYAIEHYGTQVHRFTQEEFAQRYKDNYEEELVLG